MWKLTCQFSISGEENVFPVWHWRVSDSPANFVQKRQGFFVIGDIDGKMCSQYTLHNYVQPWYCRKLHGCCRGERWEISDKTDITNQILKEKGSPQT